MNSYFSIRCGMRISISSTLPRDTVPSAQTRIKPHRMTQWPKDAGVLKLSSGGGGVGLPSERDPERVREDVVKEFVSIQRAREVYKVAIDPVSFEIDWNETRALRSR